MTTTFHQHAEETRVTTQLVAAALEGDQFQGHRWKTTRARANTSLQEMTNQRDTMNEMIQ